MPFTFLDHRVLMEWPAFQFVDEYGETQYAANAMHPALVALSDGSLVALDVALNVPYVHAGAAGAWSDLRVLTTAGLVTHPNTYGDTHPRSALSLMAGEIEPGVVGAVLWESERNFSVGAVMPPERALFFKINGATGDIISVTTHAAAFNPPDADYVDTPLGNKAWGGVCEQAGDTVKFRCKIAYANPEGIEELAATFTPKSGGVDFATEPWEANLPEEYTQVSIYAHGVGAGGSYALYEMDDYQNTGTPTPPPVRGDEPQGVALARQHSEPIFYMLRSHWLFEYDSGDINSDSCWWELLTISTTVTPRLDPSWWEGDYDDGWRPAYGLDDPIYPVIRDGSVQVVSPDSPDPWAWGALPPGAPLNGWLQWWVDGMFVRVSYNGRVVLAWRMPDKMFKRYQTSGPRVGFYQPSSGAWREGGDPPPGLPPAKTPPPDGWRFLVDTTRWEPEAGPDQPFRHGIRWTADDLLIFPDRIVGGQLLQDDLIAAAPVKHLAGRQAEPLIVDGSTAVRISDAGFGWALYPVEAA